MLCCVFFVVILQNSCSETMGPNKVSIKNSGVFLVDLSGLEIFLLISIRKIDLIYVSCELCNPSWNEFNSYLKELLYLFLNLK